MLPHDPFARTRLPAEFDRKTRVAMLKKAATLLIETGTPEGLFTGGAILSWLAEGGDLCRHYLKVTPPRGCHHTPQVVARMLEDSEP